MWLNPAEREHLGATPYQFAIYRIVLGLTVLLALAASPAPEVPAEAWLGLPRVVRGSFRLVAAVLGLALSLGVLRRAAGPLASVLAVLLALYDHTSWAISGPLAVHGLLVALPAGSEPLAVVRGSDERPIPSHWTTAAWVALAAQGVLLGLLAAPGVLSWLLAGAVLVLVVVGLVYGPKPEFVVPTFLVLSLSAWLTAGVSAVLVTLLPSAVACITQDWLPARRPRAQNPIVFFDGVCAVCDRGMQLIITEDGKGILRLAPLQGETSKQLLQLPDGVFESMIVLDDGERLERSSGALRVAEYLGGIWRLTALISALPIGVRDALYDWVARNRYDWFGKMETCRIPTPEQRQRFLD